MHCVLLSSPFGAQSWHMRRSVEMLGYHKEEMVVRALVTVGLENRLEGTPNFLRILHRGKVNAYLRPAWKLPAHPDELAHWERAGTPADSPARQTVLNKLYRAAFDDTNVLCQKLKLTGWDEYQRIEPVPVMPCKPNLSLEQITPTERGWSMLPEFCSSNEAHIPFTIWTLGPFTEPGLHLIAFELEFSAETYRELVKGDEFTVDGPQRLVARIKQDDLSRLPEPKRGCWQERLAPFETGHLVGESYDVIILRPPFADLVESLGGCGIALAPLQPMCKGTAVGDRFMTVDQAFTMAFRYAS